MIHQRSQILSSPSLLSNSIISKSIVFDSRENAIKYGDSRKITEMILDDDIVDEYFKNIIEKMMEPIS